MGREENLSRLIGGIYACASAAEEWPDVLARVSAFTGAKYGHLLIFEDAKSPPLLSVVGGVDPSSGREYDQYYASRDPRVPGFLRAVNKVVACHQLVDADEFDRSEIVNDFLLKWDARYCMIGGFSVTDGLHGVWAAMRGRHGGFFRDDELDRLSLLLPHIRQAVALQARLGLLDARRQTLEHALNLLASPVFVIDGYCRLYFTNQAGDKVLGRAAPLRLHNGRLQGSHPSLTAALTSEAARNAAAMDGSIGIARTHEIVIGEAGEPPATLLFYSLRGHGASGFIPGGEVVIFLVRGDDHRPPSSMLLHAALGLTAGEADLALSLGAGERLREIADRRGVSIETVRTQLKSIFLKTGTRRQSDLVRLVQAQSSAALRSTP